MTFVPHGKHLIAGKWVRGDTTFPSEPTHGNAHDFSIGTVADVNAAAHAAELAFSSYSALPCPTRAAFLKTIADDIEKRTEPITQITTQETGLPEARMQGERARTTGQLRLFADHILKGDYL